MPGPLETHFRGGEGKKVLKFFFETLKTAAFTLMVAFVVTIMKHLPPDTAQSFRDGMLFTTVLLLVFLLQKDNEEG